MTNTINMFDYSDLGPFPTVGQLVALLQKFPESHHVGLIIKNEPGRFELYSVEQDCNDAESVEICIRPESTWKLPGQ
jgi:hypothetical protein